MQHLAAERADIVIPDYGATLTDMVKRLGAISESLKGISGHPAMQMTPDSIGNRIAAAAEAARRSDQDRISQARSDLIDAAQEIAAPRSMCAPPPSSGSITTKWRAGLCWLLSCYAPSVPAPLPVPCPKAGTGQSAWLMQSDSLEAWNALVQAADIQRDNRDTIDACRKTAATSQQPVRCSVKIRPDSSERKAATTREGAAQRSHRGA